MNRIQVKILNPDNIYDCEKMMVAMARLTQRAESIYTMEDFERLMNKPYSDNLVDTLQSLPHPTLQKFGTINVAIVGASRRFLAQITRHQNEVKFMSGSLQYSDYSNQADFVVPAGIIKEDHDARNFDASNKYLLNCYSQLKEYEEMIASGISHDDAAYVMPQGLRNVLVVSATPYQWKHMIAQRTCNRNSPETQYIMLSIWELLQLYSPMFDHCGAPCINGTCPEGKMSCKKPMLNQAVQDYMLHEKCALPTALLDTIFKEVRERMI